MSKPVQRPGLCRPLQFGQDGCTFRVPTDGKVERHQRQSLLHDRFAQLGNGVRRICGRGQVVMGFEKCPSDSTHRNLSSLHAGEGRGVGESMRNGTMQRHDVDRCEFMPGAPLRRDCLADIEVRLSRHVSVSEEEVGCLRAR